MDQSDLQDPTANSAPTADPADDKAIVSGGVKAHIEASRENTSSLSEQVDETFRAVRRPSIMTRLFVRDDQETAEGNRKIKKANNARGTWRAGVAISIGVLVSAGLLLWIAQQILERRQAAQAPFLKTPG